MKLIISSFVVAASVAAVSFMSISTTQAHTTYTKHSHKKHVQKPKYKNTHAIKPWTSAWLSYCGNKYRSFNQHTGNYRGYDGKDHFCVVK